MYNVSTLISMVEGTSQRAAMDNALSEARGFATEFTVTYIRTLPSTLEVGMYYCTVGIGYQVEDLDALHDAIATGLDSATTTAHFADDDRSTDDVETPAPTREYPRL